MRRIKELKRKVIPIENLIDSIKSYSKESDLIKDLYNERFKKTLKNAEAEFEDEDDYLNKIGKKFGKYSLRTRIKNNTWLKTGHPANMARQWLYKVVFKDPKKYAYRHRIMFGGGLFTFQYFNPKGKGTKELPYFDMYPLVLSLGARTTKNGIRNLGFNLHYLPPKIRIIVLCEVFEIYKTMIRYNIFFNRNRPINIKYHMILKRCLKYGAGFSIKMYIPQRQNKIFLIPYNEWYKAVFLPSFGYDGITAQKMHIEWNKYIKKLGYTTSQNADWRSII